MSHPEFSLLKVLFSIPEAFDLLICLGFTVSRFLGVAVSPDRKTVTP
jgi:hypothetical protein